MNVYKVAVKGEEFPFFVYGSTINGVVEDLSSHGYRDFTVQWVLVQRIGDLPRKR